MTRYYTQVGVPTENGWPQVLANKTVSATVVAAAKAVPLLAGNVATILNAWIIAYNRDVEPITSQVWGWSPYNDVANSNHLSGTAIDINAPKYPWGTRTMNATTKAKVRALLAKFDGVVFWGADWSRADEMHYQIGLPPSNAKVAALANKLNGGYLNIYGTTEKDDTDMSLTTAQDERLNRVLANTETILKNQAAIMVQLGQPGGHPQGGGRTLYDLTAAVAEVEGVPNTFDKLGK